MSDTVPYLVLQPDHLTFEFPPSPFPNPFSPGLPPPLLVFEFLPLPAWGRGRLPVALMVFELFFHVNRGLKRPTPPTRHPPLPTLLIPSPTRVPLTGTPRLLGDEKSWKREPAGAC